MSDITGQPVETGEDELLSDIIAAATQEFACKGLRFTMQDVAQRIHISKKTIYTVCPSKEDLLIAMLDAGFANIHRRKEQILHSGGSIPERFARMAIAMPQEYRALDFRLLSQLGGKYPRALERLHHHLQTNWEPALRLLEEGQRTGCIRPVNLTVVRGMITASIEAFVDTDLLTGGSVSYDEALQQMIGILMQGITQPTTIKEPTQ